MKLQIGHSGVFIPKRVEHSFYYLKTPYFYPQTPLSSYIRKSLISKSLGIRVSELAKFWEGAFVFISETLLYFLETFQEFHVPAQNHASSLSILSFSFPNY